MVIALADALQTEFQLPVSSLNCSFIILEQRFGSLFCCWIPLATVKRHPECMARGCKIQWQPFLLKVPFTLYILTDVLRHCFICFCASNIFFPVIQTTRTWICLFITLFPLKHPLSSSCFFADLNHFLLSAGEASVSQTRKWNILNFCTVVHQGPPLLLLSRLEPICAVLLRSTHFCQISSAFFFLFWAIPRMQ